MAAEASCRERSISGSSEEFSDVADDVDDLEDEDSDGLPDMAVETIAQHHLASQQQQQLTLQQARKSEPLVCTSPPPKNHLLPLQSNYSTHLPDVSVALFPPASHQVAGRSNGVPSISSYSAVLDTAPARLHPMQDEACRSSHPLLFCSACGESCANNEAFQQHVLDKHRHPPAAHPPHKDLLKSPTTPPDASAPVQHRTEPNRY